MRHANRGVPRPLAAAFSAMFASACALAGTFTVTTTADVNHGQCTPSACTLRDAVIAANSNPGSDTIVLPPGVYVLTILGTDEDNAETGDLDIKGDLTINGSGARTTIIDGNGTDRVFQVIGPISLTLNDVTIRNGSTIASTNRSGGGIFVSQQSALVLQNVAIRDNQTGSLGDGGGIANLGIATVTNSTVSGNLAGSGGNGGGIYNGFTVRMTNCTLSGNGVSGAGFGGGFFEIGESTTIVSSTIAGNSAGTGKGGGIGAAFPLTIRNTIVANNTGSNCTCCVVQDGGTNVQFPGSTCGSTIPSADPVLGPLADNGGPTETLALTSSSVAALDKATTGCPPPNADQRGVTRPQGPACDIGSFELAVATPTPTPTATPTPTSTVTPTPTPVLVPDLSRGGHWLLGVGLLVAATWLLKRSPQALS